MKHVQYPVRMTENGKDLIIYVKVLVPVWAIRQYGQVEAVKRYYKVK